MILESNPQTVLPRIPSASPLTVAREVDITRSKHGINGAHCVMTRTLWLLTFPLSLFPEEVYTSDVCFVNRSSRCTTIFCIASRGRSQHVAIGRNAGASAITGWRGRRRFRSSTVFEGTQKPRQRFKHATGAQCHKLTQRIRSRVSCRNRRSPHLRRRCRR